MKKYFGLLAGLALAFGVFASAYGGTAYQGPGQHYKTWRLVPPLPFGPASATVRDQFTTEVLQLGQIDYLSNPTRKDGYPIVTPFQHYSWFQATGSATARTVKYDNQIALQRSVRIDTVKYLLVPTQKLPHPPAPDPFTHYKAYRIANPQTYAIPHQLEDQFDIADAVVENVGNLTEVYFITPCSKNGVPMQDSVTHYVAYSFQPQRLTPQTRQIINQFGTFAVLPGSRSELLLVPTDKILTSKVPSLTTYGLIILALLLAGTAVWMFRRRRVGVA